MMRNKTMMMAALAGLGLTGAVVDTSTAFAADSVRLVGLRRLSENEYRNSVADIFGADIQVQGLFEPQRRVGGLLAASTAILSITPAGFENYTKMADAIASQAVDEKHRAKLPCTPKSATSTDDACASQVISQYGQALFRRPLTSDEVDARVALVDKITRSSKDFYVGLRYGLTSMLSAPDFLFRTEYAIPDGKSGWTLDGNSRASRLSYMLWNTTPDAELTNAAATGVLSTDAGVAKEVDRMMASPRFVTGIRAFYTDFLELDNFGSVTKDTLIYPKFSDAVAASAKEETLRTAIDLTLTNKQDIRDLLTTRKTYLNRVLASIYGVPFDFGGDWVPYEFPESAGRSGLLTQVTTLGMFSHPGRSSPTERGVAVLDIFMCEPTPAPPPNVDFSIVNDTKNPNMRTVRQRLLAHATNGVCASCHTHSDPIGLSLEDFDSIGVYRTTENGQAIDVSSALQGKKFVGATGLGDALHDNPKFPACFARKMYAYGTGANAYDTAARMYRAPLNAFIASGYKMPVLVKALTTDQNFFSAPAPATDTKTALNDVK